MNIRSSLPVVRVDKKNGIVGAVLGAVILAVCCIWYSWIAGLVFAAMFLAVSFVKIQTGHPLVSFILNGFWGVVCIVVLSFMPTFMVSPNAPMHIYYWGNYRTVMNMVCVAAVFGVVLAITGKIKPAVAIGSGALLILATVNAFIYTFRGSELKPTDFLSIGTAMNVAAEYNFAVYDRMAYCWFVWLWEMIILRALPEEKPLIPKPWFRLAAVVAVAACVAGLWGSPDLVPLKTWTNQGSTKNGYFLNFAIGLRTCFVDKPEEYTDQTLQDLEDQYAISGETAAENRPNIIVIMNESFVDMRILGDNFNPNQDIMPFVDSLEENTIKGFALASIYGGNTANSEYEFLTGNSMAWLPNGSVPYQQYVRGETYSLAWLMRELGYTTMATHPYLSSGWHRTKVYPAFGFQSSTFDVDYPNEKLIRNYISDQEMYEYVLNILDNKGQDPMFLFGITMQNHGDYEIVEGYNDRNFVQHIQLDGYTREYPYAEVYSSLIHESDKAVEYLLTELENYPEDTIVVFFGDHYPKVEQSLYNEIHGSEFETLPEQMLQYTVPFFIWANYDIPEQTVEYTSLNFLGRYMLEAAGIELPPYYRFLAELEEAIPAVSAMGYYSRSQQTYLPLEDAQGEEAEWLNRYQIVQYNSVFDEKNRMDSFFGQYIPEQ